MALKQWFVKTFFGDVIENAVKAEHVADMTALNTALPTARKQIKQVAVAAVKTVKQGQALVAQGNTKIALGTADLSATQQLDCEVALWPQPVK